MEGVSVKFPAAIDAYRAEQTQKARARHERAQARHLWKHHATRCAVIGCNFTRIKGWSTCGRGDHYSLSKPLAGSGRIDPIPTSTRKESP